MAPDHAKPLTTPSTESPAFKPDSLSGDVLNALQTTLTIVKESIDGVPIPGLKAAVGGLLEVIRAFKNVQGNKEEIEFLIGHLNRLRDAVTEPLKAEDPSHVSESLKARIDILTITLNRITAQANQKGSRSGFKRFFSHEDDIGVIQSMNRDIDRALQAFLVASTTSMDVRAESTYLGMLSGFSILTQLLGQAKAMLMDANVQALSKAQLDLIKDLPRAHARHDSASRNNATGCFKGTREAILNEIFNWIERQDPGCPPIFWLCGLAGIGKSAIAQTVAEWEEARHRLGASYFFSRDEVDRRNPLLVFPSIAFQLALFNPQFKRRVAESLEENPDAGHAVIRQQIEKLITKPLQACGKINKPVVIVIDALDECFPESGAEEILILWAAEIRKMSQPVKILITSRPELHIRSKFQSASLRFVSQSYILHDIEKSIVEADITLFLRHRLNEIATEFGLETPWPTEYEIGLLTRRAGLLFIFVATALKFIGDKHWADPQRQLRALLANKAVGLPTRYREVDSLYLQVLQHALPSEEHGELVERFRLIVGTVVLLRDPMSARTMESFLALERGTVRRALLQLHSVLLVPESQDAQIRVFHPSFPEFITNTERCNDARFLIKEADGHARLASLCLSRMMKSLRRDICSIGDPWKLNAEVPDLKQRLDRQVPEDLRYSCLHFAHHLFAATRDDSEGGLTHQLITFCKTKLLQWVELLSLLGQVGVAIFSLRYMRHYYMATASPSPLIKDLLYDALRFVLVFAQPIRQGSGQTYVSALPLTPPCALRSQFQDEIHVRYASQGVQSAWDACICVMEGHQSPPECVTFSSDGDCIASAGGYDNTVRVWNALTGSQLLVLEGHTSEVTSVAFSPDRGRIASVSADETLRIWDTTTGTSLGVLHGHTSTIAAVLFCPDDIHVVTASKDHTIRIWDSIKCILLSTRLQHTRTVNALSSSKDGTRFASGSDDCSVLLWELGPDSPLQTLSGHAGPVNCVAFLPGDLQVASASSDQTIRIWDYRTGSAAKVLAPGGSVMTLAFAPDGSQMAFALDRSDTIQVWGMDYEPLSTLRGHNDPIMSLQFSPDSALLVSASIDRTLRQWNALGTYSSSTTHITGNISNAFTSLSFSEDGKKIIAASYHSSQLLVGQTDGTPPTTHILQERVFFAAFSSDQKRIITVGGQDEKSICVWDSTTLKNLATFAQHPVEGEEPRISGKSAVSHRTNQLASTALDSETSVIRLWDISSLAQTHALQERRGTLVECMAFSTDDTKLVSSSRRGITLWGLDTMTQLQHIDTKFSGLGMQRVVFSPSDHYVLFVPKPVHYKRVAPTPRVLHVATFEEVPCTRATELVQFDDDTADFKPRFLEVRDDWLWEFSDSREERLCWLPPQWRGVDAKMAWKGRYLAIATASGDLAVLDIGVLQDRYSAMPST